jgi:integration host factor subunit beta
MRKLELIKKITGLQKSLSHSDITLSVNHILSYLSEALIQKRRVEIRGFGNLSPQYQDPRKAKNPKTNQEVQLPGRYRIRFQMGKALKKQLNVPPAN